MVTRRMLLAERTLRRAGLQLDQELALTCLWANGRLRFGVVRDGGQYDYIEWLTP
jgi:hypothetical protein